VADPRNPYVMLGIPFGCPRELATKAFARKAKGMRRQRDAAAALTQLTWALNQVEENLRDPRTALHVYRVPADPRAFDPTGTGVLRPAPAPMPRQSGSSEHAWAELLEAARAEAVAGMTAEVSGSATLPPC
jgi:hypothetical protein